MVMQTVQIRLTETQIKKLDRLVKSGLFDSRGHSVRFAVSKLLGEVG